MRLGQVANQVPRTRVDPRGVMVDDQKIKAILQWEKSKTTKRLRSFVGLASYYCKFVRDFAKIAKPFSDLLNKLVSEIWDEHCYHTFGELKRRLTSALVPEIQEALQSTHRCVGFCDRRSSNARRATGGI